MFFFFMSVLKEGSILQTVWYPVFFHLAVNNEPHVNKYLSTISFFVKVKQLDLSFLFNLRPSWLSNTKGEYICEI